ncbi:hypothetical protein B4U79_05423 [Dinothrombium tinctorium]|uniref:C2 domain-containing protein n=1 Tax=Dinothrombium tinctorium TaxID=1965070 RepID=A0A3S3RR56_9ACAR|nr:hypothetical protein B4U79_05423 [Dinothrombium tinctorium]
MPGKVKVRVLAGRNLPVMDKSSDTSDAFVEVKLGNTTYKTEVFRHSLNPYWNSEWFRFEADDEELQDEPLQIRIMDYDTYSANDAIGKVYIDLNPLLHKDSMHIMFGWFPIYDTMHGIRGEVHLAVKVDLFSDSNRYRQSSCGVRFFYSPGIPTGYTCQAILGFVEELVVNDDPEYQWIDKIRTPRASNEARQTLFSKLSGEVKRKIGLKALDLGGNSVIGYRQCFDLEGESGIVVRGIGTAVTLVKSESSSSRRHHNYGSTPTGTGIQGSKLDEYEYLFILLIRFMPASFPIQTTNSNEDQTSNFTIPTASKGNLSSSPPESVTTPLTAPAGVYLTSPIGAPSIGPKMLTTSPKSTGMHRRGSSDPDLSTTPNCGSNHSSGSGSAGNKSAFKFMISPEGIHLLEYPFITMKQFPVGLIQHIGGVVCSRSVKLLDQINNPDDPETRDTWWMELRKEIRSHCRSLGCNAVLGYSENTNICDEVVILSAIGTAVTLTTEKEKREVDQNTPPSKSTVKTEQSMKKDCNTCDSHYAPVNCTLCHIPYTGKVPDILFMTIEPPAEMPITGIGCLIQARVCRYKRDSKGEQCAKEISDSLPFLEYEIHRQLLSKLKVKGMNGLFGLTMQISVGDNLLIALATGTGAYISAMPPPHPPQVSSGKGVQTSKLNEIQKLIFESVSKNREHYGLIHSSVQPSNDQTYEKTLYSSCNKDMNSNDSINQTKLNLIEDEESSELDKSEEMINKGQVLLEVDDTEDADIISLMIDSDIPEGYEVCNTEIMPGLRHLYVCNLQTFAQVYRAKLNTSKQFGHQFDWILQSLFVKLRRLVPCCLTDLKFTVDLPETDLVQLTVMGSVVGLGSLPHTLTTGKGGVTLPSQVGSTFRKRTLSSSDQSDDLVFSMDEDPKFESVVTELNSKEIFYHNPPTEHSGIELTPLSFVPDGHIHYYLGNLDFFFIRESTSIRESGGLNGFMHSFLSEVFAIVRAHVAALGGNAMTALHLTQCVLLYNPHKNQSQCLINIAGDAVMVHYHNSKQNMAINKIHSEINANEGIINEEAENLSHL